MSSKGRQRERGLSLLEVMFTSTLLSIFMVGIISAVSTLQLSFADNQTHSALQLRAQNTLDRLTAMTREALTGDLEFGGLKDAGGGNFHGLGFRIVTSFQAGTGAPIYNDDHKVFILGPSEGTTPCRGLIIGRGPTLTSVFNNAAGADGLLGTYDDDRTPISGTLPATEFLIPPGFAPRTGDMFTVSFPDASTQRLIQYTLRLNAISGNGGFLFENDLVLTRTISLNQ